MKDLLIFYTLKGYHNLLIFIRPACRYVLWYGADVCPSVCLCICLHVGLSAKLVNTMQTEPFQLGPSHLVHILLMTRGITLLIYNVMGQRSRSHAKHCSLNIVVKHCKQNTD